MEQEFSRSRSNFTGFRCVQVHTRKEKLAKKVMDIIYDDEFKRHFFFEKCQLRIQNGSLFSKKDPK